MIASENFVPQSVLDCQGSVLTNKYAEGYPGKRYYGGCEYVDVIETLAIERARALFGAEHANVQPHAGAQANAAVYHALCEPGDTVLGHEARPRRPPHARHEDQLLRPALQHRRLRGPRGGLAARLRRARAAREGAPAEDDPRRLVRLPARSSTSSASATSATRSARSCSRTWRTSPGSSRRASTPTRCPTRTSSRPRSTRRSAARAAG